MARAGARHTVFTAGIQVHTDTYTNIHPYTRTNSSRATQTFKRHRKIVRNVFRDVSRTFALFADARTRLVRYDTTPDTRKDKLDNSCKIYFSSETGTNVVLRECGNYVRVYMCV